MNQPGQPSLVLLGAGSSRGVYILRIRLQADLRLSFGRFKAGTPIDLPAGDYCYIGSALGTGGLASRLLRHATRSGLKPPHSIRSLIASAFDTQPRSANKRLHWNIDYLLDQEVAEITGVIALRTETRLETWIAELLQDDLHTRIVARGLGAHDLPGHTHLLRVEADEVWWAALSERMLCLLTASLPDDLHSDTLLLKEGIP